MPKTELGETQNDFISLQLFLGIRTYIIVITIGLYDARFI